MCISRVEGAPVAWVSFLTFFGENMPGNLLSGKAVHEVGGKSDHKWVRRICERWGADYTCSDVQPGPNVDLVCPAERLLDVLRPGSQQVVVAVSVLEHVLRVQDACHAVARLLQPFGLVFLSVPTRRMPYHLCCDGWAGDYWRFSRWSVEALFPMFEVISVEEAPDAPHINAVLRRPVGVEPERPVLAPKRVRQRPSAARVHEVVRRVLSVPQSVTRRLLQ